MNAAPRWEPCRWSLGGGLRAWMGRRHRVCRELMSTPPFSPLVHASLLHSPSVPSTFPGFPPTPASASKLISLLSHLPQLSPSRWSLHADPLPAIPLSPVPSESSSPLSHIPAVCPSRLDPSSSSGPMVPPAESHGCSGPQGGPHLSWDDLIPANSTGIPPHTAPSCHYGLWASLKRLCGQWRSRI